MSSNSSQRRNRVIVLTGLGIALVIATLLSPLASKDPDGLDRVSEDLKFDRQALEEPPAQKLPFYQVFEEYALRGVPKSMATPLAGLIGTLATFGLAWGVGKLAVRNSPAPKDESPLEYSDSQIDD
jgi:cobalt/nickel transport protein